MSFFSVHHLFDRFLPIIFILNGKYLTIPMSIAQECFLQFAPNDPTTGYFFSIFWTSVEETDRPNEWDFCVALFESTHAPVENCTFCDCFLHVHSFSILTLHFAPVYWSTKCVIEKMILGKWITFLNKNVSRINWTCPIENPLRFSLIYIALRKALY